jgi:hypothetical protein
VLKHGCTVTTPKLSSNYHSGKYHYHHNPRQHAKFTLRQRWCLSLFFIVKVLCSMTVLHKAKLRTSIFIMSAKVIHSTVNNQQNGSLAHGRFKMAVHWHARPKLCSSYSHKKHSTSVSTPILPFFLFSWIRNTLKGKQFEDVKTIKLTVTSRDA